jgi:hypothetical protein
MTRYQNGRRWMSSLLLATVALSLLIGGRTLRGASKLDRPSAGQLRVSDHARPDNCAMFELFDQVARAAGVPLGFENLPGCGFGQRTVVPGNRGAVLFASTPREAFDEIAALNDSFRWQEMDGMAIVRPVAAWYDADDLLNLPAHSFQLMNVGADDALYRVLQAATPRVRYVQSRKRVYGPLDAPVSVDFGGGTMLGALNAVVRAKGDAEWRVGSTNGAAAILIGRLSKLTEPAAAYVGPIWKTPTVRGAVAN